MRTGDIERRRSKADLAKSFFFGLDNPEWLWWQLHRERICCLDHEDTTMWYTLVCQAIDSLNIHDWGELARTIKELADIAGVKLQEL